MTAFVPSSLAVASTIAAFARRRARALSPVSPAIQIEDDEGRSYDPQTFEKIHAHRT